jgi:hypothetical protein
MGTVCTEQGGLGYVNILESFTLTVRTVAFPTPPYFTGTGEGRRFPEATLHVSEYQKRYTYSELCVYVRVRALEIEFGG